MADRKDELQTIIRKLEGVFRTSRDADQKTRVYDQIREAKQELQSLTGMSAEETQDQNSDSSSANEPDAASSGGGTPAASNQNDGQSVPTPDNAESDKPAKYRLINTLKINPIHRLATNEEVNFLAAVLQEFEDEYWGALSDYHLTLDYAQSNKRDSFLTMLENNKRHLKEYIKILDEVEQQPREEFKKQLQNMALKQERHVIMETTNFFNLLLEFLKNLLSDNESHGNLILNPGEALKFNKLYGDKKLTGKTVLDGVHESIRFIEEASSYLHLPSFYRKEVR